MKRKIIAILIAVGAFTSCQQNDVVPSGDFTVSPLGSQSTEKLTRFLEPTIRNGRISQNFDFSKGIEVEWTDFEGILSYSIPTVNPHTRIVLIEEDEIIKTSFVTNSQYDANSKTILVQVYDFDNRLLLEYEDDLVNRTREILFSEEDKSGRINSWWSRTGDCFNRFHTFTGHSITDYAIIAVFDAATLGTYSVFSIGFCAVAAIGTREPLPN